MTRNRSRKNNRRRGFRPFCISVNKSDALMVSGMGVLASMAMGASPDKALDYGIAVLRFFGAEVEVITDSEPETSFMVGLA
jgi:hypothetical protein